MLVNFYLNWMNANGKWEEVVAAMGGDKPADKDEAKAWVKAFSKSDYYRAYVAKALAPAERASSLIGNMYTASIFMGLLSTLCDAADKGENIEGAVSVSWATVQEARRRSSKVTCNRGGRKLQD